MASRIESGEKLPSGGRVCSLPWPTSLLLTCVSMLPSVPCNKALGSRSWVSDLARPVRVRRNLRLLSQRHQTSLLSGTPPEH